MSLVRFTSPEAEERYAALVAVASSAVVGLDFDGTLVDIAARPDAVRVAEHLPAMLARLRDRLGGALAIVSGRPIAVLDSYLAPFSFDAAGLHGAEQRIGGVVQVDETSDPARLRALALQRCEDAGILLRVPRPGLCTDNGAMVAALGAEMVARGRAASDFDLPADSSMPVTEVSVPGRSPQEGATDPAAHPHTHPHGHDHVHELSKDNLYG